MPNIKRVFFLNLSHFERIKRIQKRRLRVDIGVELVKDYEDVWQTVVTP